MKGKAMPSRGDPPFSHMRKRRSAASAPRRDPNGACLGPGSRGAAPALTFQSANWKPWFLVQIWHKRERSIPACANACNRWCWSSWLQHGPTPPEKKSRASAEQQTPSAGQGPHANSAFFLEPATPGPLSGPPHLSLASRVAWRGQRSVPGDPARDPAAGRRPRPQLTFAPPG